MTKTCTMTDTEIEYSCFVIERAVNEAIERGVEPSYINWLVSQAAGRDKE